MKALTVQQPFASAIMRGVKCYETRKWHPREVTEFALHAGRTLNTPDQHYLLRAVPDWPQNLPLGAVLGIVKLVDVTYAEVLMDELDCVELQLGYWKRGNLAWELEVVEVFENPIPARGQQGFWDWQHPATKQETSDYIESLRDATRKSIFGEGPIFTD